MFGRRLAGLGATPGHDGRQAEALGIGKRGNVYLRRLLVYGARAALHHLAKTDSGLGGWLQGLLARRHHNVVVIALANKLARIAWAVLARGRRYKAAHLAAG